MTVSKLIEAAGLEPVSVEEKDRDIEKVYCCDLLSVAMSRAPENGAWVTVMGNQNVIAVASLTEVSVVIIAEGMRFDQAAIDAAKGKVTLLRSPLPVYETAVKIGGLL